jgi:hypothetical protein
MCTPDLPLLFMYWLTNMFHKLLLSYPKSFQQTHSNLGAIFILQALVQKYLFEKKTTRHYVIFVDMMKCFESIYRNGLWLKMFKSGIQGKLLRIVRDMYSDLKSCVKCFLHSLSVFLTLLALGDVFFFFFLHCLWKTSNYIYRTALIVA